MIVALAAACQPSAAPPANPALAAPVASRPAGPTPLSFLDPCANRLHDLEECILLYAAMRHELPPSLQALRPLVTPGKTLQTTCPVSNLPYVYHPMGLTAPGESRRIILYDPTPIHDGKREAIMLTPGSGDKAPVLEVVLVTEDILRAFKAPEIISPTTRK